MQELPSKDKLGKCLKKNCIVNLPSAWGMRVPRVSLCACIYGGALAGVTCARASCVGACVRACVGDGGGRGAGVSRRACVWGGLVCVGARGGVGELVLVCVYGLAQCIGCKDLALDGIQVSILLFLMVCWI